ncbi:uncharacterized protein PAF06_015226 [Gastrophryne carolinensis]
MRCCTSKISHGNSQDAPLPTNPQYRNAIGKLMYITTATRPDIEAFIGILCRNISMPSRINWNVVKGVIHYLKGTLHYKLRLPTSDERILKSYVNANWAGGTSDRKSISGYFFLLSGGAISWTSRKQLSVTL